MDGLHHRFRTPPEATARLRELAASGLHDDEIADRLNQGEYRTGRAARWHAVAVKWASRRERIFLTVPDRPRRELLPDRQPDERYLS